MSGKNIVFAARKQMKKLANDARRGVLVVRGEAPKVAIVSCDLWKGRVYDDLLLQGEFIQQGVDAKIVSWQERNIKWGDFDAVAIGSMWGYQNFLKDFEKWLDKTARETIFINPISVIQNNYDKAKQFKSLEKAGIPIIKTQTIKIGELEKFEPTEGAFVIKPAISGSGENTFLIKNKGKFEKLKFKLECLNKEKELLVQPFVSEIRAGELGVVVIGKTIMNVVRRFPGVLEGDFKVQTEDKTKISTDIKKLVQEIANLPEYDEASYLRIDLVEKSDGLIVMEVEAFEPQLYYYLLKGTDRKKILAKMVAEVTKKIAPKRRG